MSKLIRLYTAEFRARYGEEVAALLAASDHPVRDRIDIFVHAVQERMETTMKSTTSIVLIAAAILGAASLVTFGYAVAELAGGIREVPNHWWSTLPLVGIAISATAVLGVTKLPKRSQ